MADLSNNGAASESQALTPYQEQRIAIRDGIGNAAPTAIVPTTFAEAQAFASALAHSELVPYKLKERAPDILMTILSGAELGFPPIRSLSLFNPMDGVPKLNADGLAALVSSKTLCEYLEPKEQSDTRVTWIAKKRGRPEQSLTWTIDDAKRANLCPGKLDKNGGPGNWVKYPRQMLNARCKAEISRLVFPEICAGLKTSEEFEDELAMMPPTFVAPPPAAPANDASDKRGPGRPTGSKSKVIDADSKPATDKDAAAREDAFAKAKENARQLDEQRAAKRAAETPTDSPAGPSADPLGASPTGSGSASSSPTSTPTSSSAPPTDTSRSDSAPESSSSFAGENPSPPPDDDGFGDEDTPAAPPKRTYEAFEAALAAATASTLGQVKAEWIPWSKDQGPDGGYKHAPKMREAFAKRSAALGIK